MHLIKKSAQLTSFESKKFFRIINSKTRFDTDKRTFNWQPFMNRVYGHGRNLQLILTR